MFCLSVICTQPESEQVYIYMTKWIKQVRALPSDPSSSDLLKIEYIDVNLNNSRKLISNLAELASTSREVTTETEEAVESMLLLRNIRSELAWLDELVEE